MGAREREVGQESPRVEERDLRHRLDLGEESLAAAGRAGDALEKEVPEDGEDARTLPVKVGRNGAPLPVVAFGRHCSSTRGHDTEDFEGPPSVLRLTKYFLQNGGGSSTLAPAVAATRRGCATMIEPSMS